MNPCPGVRGENGGSRSRLPPVLLATPVRSRRNARNSDRGDAGERRGPHNATMWHAGCARPSMLRSGRTVRQPNRQSDLWALRRTATEWDERYRGCSNPRPVLSDAERTSTAFARHHCQPRGLAMGRCQRALHERRPSPERSTRTANVRPPGARPRSADQLQRSAVSRQPSADRRAEDAGDVVDQPFAEHHDLHVTQAVLADGLVGG